MSKVTAAQRTAAQKHGILVDMVPRAAAAADELGMPFYVICAFLMQETNGGSNIYGHDAGMPFAGHGAVTQANYKVYKTQRDAGGQHRCQGVGPLQLTYWTIQDQADAAGGCWQPWANILTGSKIIKGYYDAARKAGKNDAQAWHQAALKFNGAEAYAVQMDKRFATWKPLVG